MVTFSATPPGICECGAGELLGAGAVAVTVQYPLPCFLSCLPFCYSRGVAQHDLICAVYLVISCYF